MLSQESILLDRCFSFLSRDDVEGMKLSAYKCSSGVLTIGVGTTIYPGGKPVRSSDSCTIDQARLWCCDYLLHKVFPTLRNFQNLKDDCIFIACASLLYNVGVFGNSMKSCLSSKTINRDFLAEVFRLYVFHTDIDGFRRLSPGLKKRRELEIGLFL